ncbi:MAG: hypothetical protein ACRDNK_04000, partial [Solirubrobacteraceae bacterium]
VVSYALMPQIHADDERSIVEGLEAQADVVRSARALAGGRPIAVTPVTLVPRHGPLGERLAVARTDARQASWFAAAWTLGSLSQLARGGADSVTYYETIGERGISPLEDLAVTHGGESPLYRLLAELADWRASRVLQCTINDPLRAAGLALQRPDGAIRVLVADLSGDANTILVGPIALDSARLRMLGERARDGAQSRPQPARSTAVEGGMVSVELGPYGVACIDADRSVVV